ncbi:MAG: EAL domain-containing protein [Clostridium butyricum]|nr:EAL domain-containing protein [Clostridium butyricum]
MFIYLLLKFHKGDGMINVKNKKKSILKRRVYSVINGSVMQIIILNVMLLLDFSRETLIFLFIIINLFGVLIFFCTDYKLIKPLRLLSEKVKNSDPSKHLKIKKTNIEEIDNLVDAIEELSEKVADSSSKLSQIINLLNMPIGAFEYTKNDSLVYCTEGFFRVIGVDSLGNKATYFDKSFFEEIIEEITNKPEPEMKEIYRIDKSNSDRIWIKLKINEEKKKKFGVVIDVTQEVIDKRKIKYERDYDILTNILNRRAFYNKVTDKLIENNLKIGAFVMWDLDNLKYVNDTYGHDCGDDYIRKAAVILKKFEQYRGFVARRSGDEFLVFLYGFNNEDEIRKIVERVHNDMENAFINVPNGRKLKLRASTGIAWYPKDAVTFENLAKFSDFAMYKIKKTVKGSISEFNKKEYENDYFLLSSQEDLNKLLDEELVRYAFQPIIRADNGEIFAYEALMRSELETLKNPLHIIKLATADSRLYEVEKLTFFKSLECYVKNRKYFKNRKLFINSIPNYVLANEDLERFEKMYKRYLDNIVVEILENEQSNIQGTSKKAKLISSWKSQVAIDDFGSGYNNEAILLAMTPDYVKIDMEIVRGINNDLNRQQICKNLVSYAKQRDIKVVAEGVEYVEELEKLIELGVDFLQGYYFSRPEFIPPEIPQDKVETIISINKKFRKEK